MEDVAVSCLLRVLFIRFSQRDSSLKDGEGDNAEPYDYTSSEDSSFGLLLVVRVHAAVFVTTNAIPGRPENGKC
jgi:hypothetical protein